MSEPTPADKAFTQSGKHALGDLTLMPWTPDRIIKAQELGMLFPNLGEAGWRQYRKTAVYPGAIRDVMLFVFLSTTEPEHVEDATYEAAKAFGVKRKLHKTDTKEFWEAFTKFLEVQREIDSSVAVPKSDDTAPQDDDEEADDPKD